MKRTGWILLGAAAGMLVLSAAFAQDEDTERKGPSVLKLPVDGVTAVITFEKGPKVAVTSKGAPLAPGTYWLTSLSLFKKDAKKVTWELRGAGGFGGLSPIIIDAHQEKFILLGKAQGLSVQANQTAEHPGAVVVTVVGVGQNGETYLPGAIQEGKGLTMPGVIIKDAAGNVLAKGQFALQKENHGMFLWQYPAGFKGAFTVEILPVMGPFEYKVGMNVQPVK